MGPCKRQESCGRRDERERRGRVLVFALLCLFSSLELAAIARAESQGVALQLEVSVNGAPLHLIGGFTAGGVAGMLGDAQKLPGGFPPH
jgi:hypothetical protein